MSTDAVFDKPDEQHHCLISPFFRLPISVQLLTVFGTVFLLATGGIVLTRESGHIAAIWLANAWLLAILLETSRQKWLAFFLTGFLGSTAANLYTGGSPLISLGLSAANTLEVAIALLMIKRFRNPFDISVPSHLMVFTVIAGLIAPATTALTASTFLHVVADAPFLQVLATWYCADALGMLVLAPFLLARQSRFDRFHEYRSLRQPQALALIALNLIIVIAVFSQSHAPLLYLAGPALLLVSFYVGIVGAAVSTALITVVAITLTVKGSGPLSLIDGSMAEKILILQSFIVTCGMTSLFCAAVVTQQRRFQAELERLKQLAEQAHMAKSNFLATMSHELRTPLTSIVGTLALLKQGAGGQLDEKGSALLRVGADNANRLLHMINDILDMESVEAGKLRLDNRRVDLGPLVEQASQNIKNYRPDKKIRISLSNDASDAKVRLDPDRFDQVLANLLSNAIKFSPPSSDVALRVLRPADGKVRVEVRDSGPGIPESMQDRIFQKFEQGDSGNARLSEGSGLGLSIAKALVEAMDGNISYSVHEGQGTSFYVDFPEDMAKAAYGQASGIVAA